MQFYENLEQAMQALSGRGAFLTVKDADGRVNTMTISWGYVGFSWGKPHFMTLVRTSRFTHDLLDTADSFTISIPYGQDMAKALGICGSKSGRDCDKAAEAGIEFIAAQDVASPVVGGCDMYYECKIRYADPMDLNRLDGAMRESSYRDGDYHDLYYGEIVKTYGRD